LKRLLSDKREHLCDGIWLIHVQLEVWDGVRLESLGRHHQSEFLTRRGQGIEVRPVEHDCTQGVYVALHRAFEGQGDVEFTRLLEIGLRGLPLFLASSILTSSILTSSHGLLPRGSTNQGLLSTTFAYNLEMHRLERSERVQWYYKFFNGLHLVLVFEYEPEVAAEVDQLSRVIKE
jgi:hypothetical protein